MSAFSRIFTHGAFPVALIAAGMLALSGCGASTGHLHKPGVSPTATRTSTIPFAPLPASASLLELPATAAAEPSCTAKALSAKTDGGGGAGGSWYMPVRITNTGEACALDLANTVVGYIDASGTTHSFGTIHPAYTTVPAPVLEKSATIKLLVSLPETCDAGASSTGTVTTSLTVDGKAVALSGDHMPARIAACAGDGSGVDQSEPQSSSANTDNVHGTLTAVISHTEKASPGGTLDYTVTLRNTGGSAVSLAACPDYVEQLNVDGTISHKTYQLNCDGHTAIAAGTALNFAMQIPVPDTSSPTAKLFWTLSKDVFAGSVVAVG